MKPTNDYTKIVETAFEEFAQLLTQRQEVELKVAQKLQFIRATLNLLSESDRTLFEGLLDKMMLPGFGLADSIRAALSATPKKWHTAADVRDALVKSGFNFTAYSTNPLASVHATLKRLKPEEAETTEIDGVMAWRAKGELTARHYRRRRRRNYYMHQLSSLGELNSVLTPGTPESKEFYEKIRSNLYPSKK